MRERRHGGKPAGRPRTTFGTGLAAACLTGALLLGHAAEGRATRERPPAGYTGGFGEAACNACHFAAALNAGSGSLTLDGIRAEYDAGATYTLAITLTQRGLAAAGFELSARFADGTQAGTLAAAAPDSLRIGDTTQNGVQYIHHIYEGTEPVAPDTARWTILWSAPLAGGAVVFDVAANAADDDASPLGDFIYSMSARSAARK